MSVHSTGFDGSLKDLFKKVLYRLYDTTDRKHPQEWRNVYNDLKTKDDFERMSEVAGLEPASYVIEGAALGYQTPVRGNDVTYTQREYGTSFRITDRMKRTNKWALMEKWTRSLAEMQRYCKDVEAAKLWIDPTGATYTYKGYDTLDFAENAHTGLLAGSTADNYDNYTTADLAHATVADGERYFDGMVDSMGHIYPLVCDTLVIGTELRHKAEEIFGSDKKDNEFSNTKNVLNRDTSVFVYHFLTSATMWYLIAKNDRNYDVNMFTLMEPDRQIVDAPDNTRDTIVSSIQYFRNGFGDPRHVYCGNT